MKSLILSAGESHPPTQGIPEIAAINAVNLAESQFQYVGTLFQAIQKIAAATNVKRHPDAFDLDVILGLAEQGQHWSEVGHNDIGVFLEDLGVSRE